MSVQVRLNVANLPFELGGNGLRRESQTILKDTGRAAVLANHTLMAQGADGKWVPLTTIAPAVTPGKLVCGAWGDTLGNTQAVTDGEFAVTVNGVLINILGLDFSETTTLPEVADVINAVAAGRFTAVWDSDASVLTLIAPVIDGASSISVLSAVAGGSGTDMSGAAFINGATGTGTATAGTVITGANLPQGIYDGSDITAAALVAADVTGKDIIVANTIVDEDQLVLENSLDLDDVMPCGLSIRAYLRMFGIIPVPTTSQAGYENA
jgi:hypothetical protein